MKKILQKLRFKSFLFRKTFWYTDTFLQRVHKIYLNHTKVIHYRDGHPVYSLTTPAVYSGPAANMYARSIYSTIQNRNIPNLMSFAVDDICNANCKHCSFFTSVDDKTRTVLTLEESKKLIKDAQKLGVSVMNFVGGEPLMRDDLLEIIESVDKELTTTILFTNGILLADKAQDLKKHGLDGVYISIDSADEKTHDAKRMTKGIFQKALRGIEAAKKANLSVGISCCITQEEFRDGELKKIIELAKERGVHEVIVFDAVPTGKLKGCSALVDNNDWIEEMIEFTEKYNEDLDYPGILIYAYATSYRSTGCSGGTSYFYVSPYGDISPCDFNHRSFGNILEMPLHKAWERMTTHHDFKQASWNGCKMKDSSYLNRQK